MHWISNCFLQFYNGVGKLRTLEKMPEALAFGLEIPNILYLDCPFLTWTKFFEH